MDDSQSKAVLVGIAHEFAMREVGLYDPPERGHITGSIHSIAAESHGVVGNNVMKHDQPSFFHQWAVEHEVAAHASKAVISIDEQQVQRLSAERGANTLQSARSL